MQPVASPELSYRREAVRGPSSLDRIFSPRSIAVIGATERPGSVGRTLLENLTKCGFAGAIYPVNLSRSSVLGIQAYPSIHAVPEPVDMALIVTHAAVTPDVVADCAAAGVGGAVIISAGFRETGPGGAALEREIDARRRGMRVIGPNCLGIIVPHWKLNAAFALGNAQAGNIAFLSQSGALCSAILDWSQTAHVGFSAFVSMGTMLDAGWCDLIEYFGNDPHTRSIVCYMESVGDGRALLKAARNLSRTKPIIILKVGRTRAGSMAAASHTGALTESEAVVDAAFRQAGILRVDTIEDLFHMAEIFSTQPVPAGPRLAILTNAGGPAALAADALVLAEGTPARLSERLVETLDRLLPEHSSGANPIDLLGTAPPELYGQTAILVTQDPGVDGLLVTLTPQTMTNPEATASAIIAATKGVPKPVLASWMGGASVATARGMLRAAGIPTFDYPDAAARAFGFMWQRSRRLRNIVETPQTPILSLEDVAQRGEARSLLDDAAAAGHRLLTEVESKRVLGSYGLPVVDTRTASSEEEAVARAQEIGFPVVVKLLSRTITHKASAGGVFLDLRNPDEVHKAWRSLHGAFATKGLAQGFFGVSVQPMVSRVAAELIVGSSVDPHFGPVLLFGAGGSHVETVDDHALALAPVNARLARSLVSRTRISRLLVSLVKSGILRMDDLADVIVRVGELVTEQSRIVELDVNPLVVSSTGLAVVDARIVIRTERSAS